MVEVVEEALALVERSFGFGWMTLWLEEKKIHSGW